VTPQQRADQLRIFQRELETAVQAGALALTSEQQLSVDAYVESSLRNLAGLHDVDTTEPEKQLSLGMRIVSALGGLALCIALALFLNRYMGYWPAFVQVATLVALPLFFTGAAHFAAVREQTKYFAALLSLVAFAAFVANLALLGDIFNLAPTPNALAMWGLFGVALGYHLGVRLVLAFGLTSLLGWIASATGWWSGLWWLELGHQPEDLLLAGLALAFVPRLLNHERYPGFPATYRLVGMLAFFWGQLYLSFSGDTSHLPWVASAVEYFYRFAGVATSAIAVWIGIRNRLNEVVNTATAFFAIFLFFRLIDWWWNWMPKYLFFLLVGLVALALVAAFKRIRSGMRTA
jgi:uncharacterized membrane protein